MLTLAAESGGVSHEAHLDAYLAELRLHRYSDSSKGHATRVLGLFFIHLREKSVHDLRAVGEAELVSFARGLREGSLSLWTQSTYLSTLRRFFAFLERRNVMLENPAKNLPLPRAQRLPRAVLSQGQAERLMEAPRASSALGLRDRAILEVLYGTAVRLRECTRLEVFDVDLSDRTLWVRNGKGRKDRVLPLPRRAAKALDHYFGTARPELVHDAHETAFFLATTGRRLSSTQLGLVVRGHGVAAGIPWPVHPHALRHACATHLLERGADIRHIQELLGHAHVTTTARYTNVSLEGLRQVLRSAHPREKAWKGGSRRRPPR